MRGRRQVCRRASHSENHNNTRQTCLCSSCSVRLKHDLIIYILYAESLNDINIHISDIDVQYAFDTFCNQLLRGCSLISDAECNSLSRINAAVLGIIILSRECYLPSGEYGMLGFSGWLF
jgi:hypothetical protein